MMTATKFAQRQSGFTLIEILVALSIVAVALAAVIQSTGNAINHSGHLRDKIFAQWVADNLFSEIRSLNQFPATGTTKGKTEMAGREWHWQRKVIKTPDDAVRRIDYQVFPSDDLSQSPLISFSGFATQAVQPVARANNNSEESNNDNSENESDNSENE